MKYFVQLFYHVKCNAEVEANTLEEAIEKAGHEWSDHDMNDFDEIDGHYDVIDDDTGNTLYTNGDMYLVM